MTHGWKKDGGKTARDDKESGGTGMDGGVKSGPERDKNDGRSVKKKTKKNRARDEWCDGTEAFPALIFYDRWRVFPFPRLVCHVGPSTAELCLVTTPGYYRWPGSGWEEGKGRGGRKKGRGGEATFFFFPFYPVV